MKLSKEELKTSLEYKWYVYNLFTFLIIGIFLMVVFFAAILTTNFFNHDYLLTLQVFLMFIGIYAIFFTPFIIYYFYKISLTLSYINIDFDVYEVKLDNPNLSMFGKGALYFDVTFKSNKNRTINFKTIAMFHRGLLCCHEFKEYNNQLVKVFYNEDKDIHLLFKK